VLQKCLLLNPRSNNNFWKFFHPPNLKSVDKTSDVEFSFIDNFLLTFMHGVIKVTQPGYGF
jgi:hypothetical protein